MSRFSTGWRAAVGAVAVVAAVTGTTGVALAAPSTATITIDTAHPAGRLAPDFVGLSFEMRELGIGNLDPARGNAAALFRTLGCGNVHISGNTLDRDTLWVPEVQEPPNPLPSWVNDVVTPADIKRLNRFLAVTGWNTVVGINLGRWDEALAADEKARMSMVTAHQYSAGPDATIATLLAPSTVTAQLKTVSTNLAAAKADGLTFRVDEANSAYSGGVDGVSNKYASALWGLDYALQMAQTGVDGINVHGGLGVCDAPIWNGEFQRYTPICAANAADEQAGVYRAMPVYYGLWMARQLKSGAFLPLTLTTDRNVTAYAVRGDDGRTRIAVVQKDETSAAPVHLDIAVNAHGDVVLRLTGTALGEEATAVQGATVDRQGHLAPGRPDRARVSDGRLGVDVAAGSAVVITLDDC